MDVVHNRPRLPSLTGLRFFAALSVFIFHAMLPNSPIPPFLPVNFFADPQLAHNSAVVVGKLGFLGVSFFFILSGFVLTWSWKEGQSKLLFIRRRIVKIFPNHLTLWVVCMVLFAAAITPWKSWLPNFFLIHAWFPQNYINAGVNTPSWTLSCEFLFYVLFPFLVPLILRIPAKYLWYGAAAMVLGMAAVELVNVHLIPSSEKSELTPIPVLQLWFGYLFPPVRLFEFFLGVFIARIVAEGRWLRVPIWATLLGCLAGYLVAMYTPFVVGFFLATAIPLALLIGAAATSDIEGRSRFLSSRFVVWLGDISFAFYICQGVALFYVRHQMGDVAFSAPIAILVILALFFLNILMAWLLHTFVESPAMRHLARPKRKPKPAAPASVPVGVPVKPAIPQTHVAGD
ncbi:acyltransferase family protein [Nocardia iowensis]|uniref:Acyltransferase n=1 Tax=Nocardia iowensis TaxID=204891 RepID=A0ABX8RQW6_NOCIO|nr:acyltransferase [Nocardia iowensis]QXN90810.1 acyltransferase [Nocardia iowensis]